MFKGKQINELEFQLSMVVETICRLKEGVICLNDMLLLQKEVIENMQHEIEDIKSGYDVMDDLLDDVQSFMKCYENTRFSNNAGVDGVRRDLDGMIKEVERVKQLLKKINKEENGIESN